MASHRGGLLFALTALAACSVTPSQGEGESGNTTTTTTTTTATTNPTSTTTGIPSESETDTGDTDLTFVPPEDDVVEIASCDPYQQDCPEDEKCVPYASDGGGWNDFKCVPILGDQTTGEACTYDGPTEATDNCDGTSHCWNSQEIDGEWIGSCHDFCMGSFDDPTCPPSSHCLIGSEGVPSLCIPDCDPIAQDCDEGLACYWANNNFNCIFTTENHPIGAPCGFINDCEAGLSCLTAEVIPDCEGSACCSPFCDLMQGDDTCAGLPGTSCSAFFPPDNIPPGYEHLGVCIIPPP